MYKAPKQVQTLPVHESRRMQQIGFAPANTPHEGGKIPKCEHYKKLEQDLYIGPNVQEHIST